MNTKYVVNTIKRCSVVALLGAFLLHQSNADQPRAHVDALSVLVENVLTEAKRDNDLRQRISIATNALDITNRSEQEIAGLAGNMPQNVKENVRNRLSANDRRNLLVKSLYEFFHPTPKNEAYRFPLYVDLMKQICTPCNNADVARFCQAHQTFLTELQKYAKTGGSVWTFGDKLTAAYEKIQDAASKEQIKNVMKKTVAECGKMKLLRVVNGRLGK